MAYYATCEKCKKTAYISKREVEGDICNRCLYHQSKGFIFNVMAWFATLFSRKDEPRDFSIKKKNEMLDRLVRDGDLQGYRYTSIDKKGNPEEESKSSNNERLILYFPTNRIVIDTSCSGFSQNTSIEVYEHEC